LHSGKPGYGGLSGRRESAVAVIWRQGLSGYHLWDCCASVQKVFLWDGAKDATAMALFTNSMVLLFIPYSTFREPLGIVRMATGLVLAVVLFAVQYKRKKTLNYAMFWIAMLVMLLNS